MQSLVKVLDSEMGQSMRVYGSTFLWFIPFVRSIMELPELNASFISEVIHYLCDKILANRHVLTGQTSTCDKVTEFFTRILIQIVELHSTEGRMGILARCAPKWVEVIVMCIVLSDEPHGLPDKMGGIHSVSSTSYNLGIVGRLPTSGGGIGAIILGCMTLIRLLLKEGIKTGSVPRATHFLNLLNKQLRGATNKRWNLKHSESLELQKCLKNVVRSMQERTASASVVQSPSTSSVEATTNTVISRKSMPTLQPQHEDQEAGPSRACGTSFIKEEPHLNYGDCFLDEEFCSGLENIIKAKNEPPAPVLISELRPTVELERIKPDLDKLQEIRSKLNNQNLSKIKAITKRKPDESLKPVHLASAKEERGFRATEDEDDDDDDEPLNVRQAQLKKSARHKLETSDSEVDCRDVGKMHTMSTGNSKESIESSTIVISDDEDSDNDERPKDISWPIEKECAKKNKSTEHPDLPESPGRDYDDLSESQVFEFETQQYMASAWNDSDLDASVLTKKSDQTLKPQVEEAPREASPSRSSENVMIPDEACQQAEDKIRQQQPQEPADPCELSKASSTAESWDKFVKPKPLQVKSTKTIPSEKRDKSQPKKPLIIDALAQKVRRHHLKRSSISHDVEEPSSSTTPSSSGIQSSSLSSSSVSSSYFSASTSRGTPAIVPPKKVRKVVEPESTAERLGLKKKERKAFDLSQRSLDCVAKLRCHGQKVQVEPQQKIRRVRTTKTAPHKRMVKSNKKLMGSQDIQFFKQSREKHQRPATGAVATFAQKPAKINQPDEVPLSKPTVASNGNGDFLPCFQPDPNQQHDNEKAKSESSDSRGDGVGSTRTIIESKYFQASEPANVNMEGKKATHALEEDVDEEWMMLTQSEPTDMEMCSQMEELEDENEELFLTQRDPVDMDLDSDSESDFPGQPVSTHKPFQTPHAPLSSTMCNDEKVADHLFLKPGLPPMKKTKPSTTKIYNPSSRSASLVLEMEKGAKPPPAANVAKARIPRLPPAMPPPKTLQPVTPPQFTKPFPSQQTHLSHAPRLVTSTKVYQRPETPVNKPAPTMDQSPKFDLSVFTQAILKWEYRMLENYKTFGSPTDLCQLPLKEVPVKFPSYLEYFNSLYPLLLINAFEEVGLHLIFVMPTSLDVIETAF